jgi:hypothetical protein
MILTDGVWRLWREAQLLAALHLVFAGGGRTIKGALGGSADGSRWKHGFDLNYLWPG